MTRCIIAAAAALAWAVPVAAADLDVVAPGPVIIGTRPTALEGVRDVHSRIGRNVVTTVNGAAVPTIEWRVPVELRVRTFTGVPLTEGQRAAVRTQEPRCLRGTPQTMSERTEVNDTFVVRYDCVWLQGFEPAWQTLLPQ